MFVEPEPSKPLSSPIYTGVGSHITPLLVPQPLRKILRFPGNFLQTEHLIIPQLPAQKFRVNDLHVERNLL